MKRTTVIALLSCCISVLAVVFADTRSAFADHGEAKPAEQAASAGTEDAMKNFLNYVIEALENLSADGARQAAQVEFRNALRANDGVYRHDDTYSIVVNPTEPDLKAGEVIYFHAGHRTATSGSLRDIDIFEELMDKVEAPGGRGVACVQDPTGEYGNHICGAKSVLITQAGNATIPIILVVGFHNELEEVSFDRIESKCPVLGPEYFGQTATDIRGEEFTRTRASDVVDEESLVNYLKTVETHIGEEIGKPLIPVRHLIPRVITGQATPEERAQVQKATGQSAGLFAELQYCWRQEPWRSGSIYFYLIAYGLNEEGVEDGTIQYGVYNGLTAEFHDRSFRLYDGCLDVGLAVFDEVNKQDDTPNEGFLKYYWTNPELEGADRVVDESGNRIEGLSPGRSVKLGYFLKTSFIQGRPASYVLVSGIYPEGETYYVPESGECEPPPDTLSDASKEHLDKFPAPPEDDGGCAIASGAGNSLKVAAFNLLLITAVLFLAVSRRNSLDKKFRI